MKKIIRKALDMIRRRSSRRLRERIFRSFSKAGLGLKTMKAAEDFIMAAPRRHRSLREQLVVRYNTNSCYNSDGNNPVDTETGLRIRKALLVEGWLLRSELETDQRDRESDTISLRPFLN